MSAGDVKSVNFKPSPNFLHMKKYFKFKFEEAGKVLEQLKTNVSEQGTLENIEQEQKVKLVLQPPLPPNSPPPDSPPHFVLKREIEDDLYELNTDEKDVQPDDYPSEFEPAAKQPKKTMCKDFVRGTCKRGDSCIYAHELDLTQLKGVYKFCRDFANGKCKRSMCFFVHASTFEKENFFRTGSLPPHTLSHLKEGNVGRPNPMPEGPIRDMPVYPITQAKLPTIGGIPPIPIMAVPPTSVIKPKLPQDLYQAGVPPNRYSLKQEWSECTPAAPVPCQYENTDKCLNCEYLKLRYQQNQEKKQKLIKSSKSLDESFVKLAKKKKWLTTVLKVLLSCPDSYNVSDITG